MTTPTTTGTAELPEALRLADALDAAYILAPDASREAAAELRRLHKSAREGWRHADELKQDLDRLRAQVEALSAAQAGAPAGYVLVPKESTAAMQWAFARAETHYRDGIGRAHPMDNVSAFKSQYAAMLAAAPQPPAQAPTSEQAGDTEVLRERDEAEEFIDVLLDEVLGTERAEWSSAYGWAEALIDVQERITALHTPAINKAWHQFQEAIGGAQSPAPAQPGQEGEREAFIRWYMEYLHTDEMLAAYVWDNEHIVPQTWRAARARLGRPHD